MRFLVLGAGALGGYFGGKLIEGGADVTFLVRPKRAAQLAERGLVVRSHEGEIRVPARTVAAGASGGPYDVVLLCCKAYDLDDALAAVAPALGPNSATLPMLNGMRHIETLRARFGAARVLGGLTAVNAALEPNGDIVQSPLKIDMTATGELDGSISPRCLEIQRAFAAGGMKIAVSETIEGAMWAKFSVFVGIACIATLMRARAGVIARAPGGSAFVDAVIEECARISAAEGHPMAPQAAGILRGMFSQPESNYGPSMLVDVEAGRPTEGEHTIGDMVERAQRRGIDAPLLTAARCNLQAYELTRQKS